MKCYRDEVQRLRSKCTPEYVKQLIALRNEVFEKMMEASENLDEDNFRKYRGNYGILLHNISESQYNVVERCNVKVFNSGNFY